MEKLEIKKVYVDTRFKTDDSKGDTDFIVELPKTFNVPDDVVCYISDVAIPVSWATIGERNNKLYLSVEFEDRTYWMYLVLLEKNYNGVSFAEELQEKLNATALAHCGPDKLTFVVTYNITDNTMIIEFQDMRIARTTTMEVILYSDEDVRAGVWNNTPTRIPQSIADNIRLTKSSKMKTGAPSHDTPEEPYECYLNLHAIRNLYLHSSALSNYDTVSNFGMGAIVKKIPVRANYNEMIFDGTNDGFDYTIVSKRSLSRLDFRLTDAYGSPIDLRNNHWSFSLVFQRTS